MKIGKKSFQFLELSSVKKVSEWIHKNELLILLCCATVLVRIPSWFEPYWYGDEAIYLTIGQALNKGVKLYSQIHDNKPPLLYLMAAIASGKLFWFKLLATVSAVTTIILFARLTEKLMVKKWAVTLATILFTVAISWPKLEGNIANAELFFLLPTVAAVNILIGRDLYYKKIFVAGILIGIATLYKVPAAIEAVIWPLLWFSFREKNRFKNSLVLFAGLALPILISGIYYLASGSLQDYIKAAWLQNIPYLSSWGKESEATGVYDLKNRLFVLTILLTGIFSLNKKWGRNITLISAWLVVTLFASLLSGRPYPHYLLQVVPPAVLATVSLVLEKPIKKIILVILLGITAAAIAMFNFYNYKVVDYYRNFSDWAIGKKTTEEYIFWFGQKNLMNYHVADLVKKITLEDDHIFVWGDEPMIYALTERLPVGKYTVKYHISDFDAENETMSNLSRQLPAAVISYGNENMLPGFSDWIKRNYQPEAIVGNAVIFIPNANLE